MQHSSGPVMKAQRLSHTSAEVWELLAQPDPPSALPSLVEKEGRRSWDERGWTLSLPYYEALRMSDMTSPAKGQTVQPKLNPVEEFGATLGAVLFRRSATQSMASKPCRGDVVTKLLQHVGPDCDVAMGSYMAWRLCAYNVQGLEPGIYSVDTEHCETARLAASPRDDLRDQMRRVMVGQHVAESAAFTFLMLLKIRELQRDCPVERALADAWVDAGRLAQRLVLGATALGLRTHQSPAVRDSELMVLIGSSIKDELPMYTLTFG